MHSAYTENVPPANHGQEIVGKFGGKMFFGAKSKPVVVQIFPWINSIISRMGECWRKKERQLIAQSQLLEFVMVTCGLVVRYAIKFLERTIHSRFPPRHSERDQRQKPGKLE
jgi:hypothetical protein